MNFRFLKSLGTSQTFEGVQPWDFKCPGLNPLFRSDKKLRDAWITSRSTEHHVYGIAVGRNPNQRISAPSKSGEGNPPVQLLGIAADFDSPAEPTEVFARIEKEGGVKPMWYERTLSGNVRLVWVFESPVLIPGFQFSTTFLTLVVERLRLTYLLPGLDHKATINTSRYFTNSGEWYPVPGGVPVSDDLVQGWLVEAGTRHHFQKDPETRGDEFTDLAPIAAALKAKYPKFAEWPGEFTVGEMGPTFWILESQSPKSATVRPGGMQTFSANAGKAFYSWSDLLDSSVVQSLNDTNIGAAVAGIYFDDLTFFIPGASEAVWQPVNRDLLELFLVSRRGLSRKTKGDSPSQVDQARLHIAQYNRVAGVGSAVFFPPGPRRGADGRIMLNTCTRTVLQPTEERGMIWGPTGQFPFLSALTEHVLPNPEARIAFLGWLSHGYAGAYNRNPVPGQAIFFVGPPDMGKSLYSLLVIGELFGGSVDAGVYLQGKEGFGGELFDYGCWRTDDNNLITTPGQRDVVSERIKQAVASNEVRVHLKYRNPTTSAWYGRIVGATNDDAFSLSSLPVLSSSLNEKVSMFRTGTVKYPGLNIGREHTQHTIATELAFFARWLLEHPPKALGCPLDNRFGVAKFHDASLVEESWAQSTTATTVELVRLWRRTIDSDEPWIGSALQLRMAMSSDLSYKSMLDKITHDRFRRDLLMAADAGENGLAVVGKYFEIHPEKKTPVARVDIPPKAESQYGRTP